MSTETISPEATERLTRIVRPRGDWFGLSKICRLLETLLEDLEQASEGQFCQKDLESSVALLAHTESPTELIKLTENPRGVSGLMMEHPQHGGLLKITERETLIEVRRGLIVLVIVCTDRWASRIERLGTDHEKYKARRRELNARLYDVWLGIRKLNDEALVYLNGSLSDLQTLTARLAELSRDYDSRTLDRDTRDYFERLERYFAYFKEHRQGREISVRERGKNKTLR